MSEVPLYGRGHTCNGVTSVRVVHLVRSTVTPCVAGDEWTTRIVGASVDACGVRTEHCAFQGYLTYKKMLPPWTLP